MNCAAAADLFEFLTVLLSFVRSFVVVSARVGGFVIATVVCFFLNFLHNNGLTGCGVEGCRSYFLWRQGSSNSRRNLLLSPRLSLRCYKLGIIRRQHRRLYH